MIPANAFQPVATRSRIILGEGLDDARLFEAICHRNGISAQVQISCYAEHGKLGDFLDVLVRDVGFEAVTHVGLTRDSDKGAEPALQSLRGSWERTKKTLASLKLAEPHSSFFAVPNNASMGRIENLCLDSPTFPAILVCAEQAHACALQHAGYAIDREKSIVNAYLSMMEKTGLNLGTGASAGCWKLDSPAMGALRDFILALAQ